MKNETLEDKKLFSSPLKVKALSSLNLNFYQLLPLKLMP